MRYKFGGLIFGGAYFRNCTVTEHCWKVTEQCCFNLYYLFSFNQMLQTQA